MPHHETTFGRTFLIALIVLVAAVFFYMVRAFFVPVLLAAVFSALFYPLYERLVVAFRERKGLAALTSCLLLLLVLIVPLYLVGDLVSREAVALYDRSEDDIQQILDGETPTALTRALESPWISRLGLDTVDWKSAAQRGATAAARFAARVAGATSRGTFQVLLVLFVTLFTMFYFFRDGPRIVRRLKHLIPLTDEHEDAILTRFVAVSRATIRGTLVIALIQGALGGITLWIFGVASPILWGVVMVLLSIVPVIGGWLVLYPAALIQLLQGNGWQALGIFLVTVIVIVNVDNVLRPRLVGQEAGMHDLMVFFSTLGGIGMFGPMGFIIGPVIAALLLTLLDIYSTEFAASLTSAPIIARPGTVVDDGDDPEPKAPVVIESA
jgi:predicted PurR-regulated permease PerM